eukprot:symbB.v1.2.024357.t1/scaffold2299.1/size82953/2
MRYLSAVVGFNGVVEGGEDLEDLSRRWNLHLKDSLQSVNKIAESLGWNTTDIADFLATSRSGDYDMYQVRGIKLRKMDRELLDSFTRCDAGSVICRLQTLTKSPHFFTEVDPMSGSVVEETKALEL